MSTVGVASRDACVVLGDFNSFAYTYGHLPGAYELDLSGSKSNYQTFV